MGINIKKIKIFFYQLQENSDDLLCNNIKYYSPYFWIGQHVLKAVQTLEKKFYYSYLFNLFCFVFLLFCICDLFTNYLLDYDV